MSAGQLKGIGIGCFVLCAILLFVAWERYDNNAKKVEAANRMMQSSPMGGMMQQMTGQQKLEPSIPAATKYSLIFAAISAVVGVVCVVKSQNVSASPNPTSARNPQA